MGADWKNDPGDPENFLNLWTVPVDKMIKYAKLYPVTVI
jgi:hypothetical protein